MDNLNNNSNSRYTIVSRDEMNLAEFPLAVLSTRGSTQTKTLEFSDTVKTKNGEPITRSWIITGADKFGLPTSSDDEVLLGLLKLTVDQGVNGRKIYFTRYELMKSLRWPTEGRNYIRLQKALDRLSGVRIKATNAFYDNVSKSHSTKNFGIIDEYEINSSSDKKSFFVWSDILFKSFQAGFIKKLDLDFYLNLESAVSKRLYRYLDKHFWYKNSITVNVFMLAHEKVGISRNFKFVSSLRQQLDPALEELRDRGFIEKFSYDGKGKGCEITIFSKESAKGVARSGLDAVEANPESAKSLAQGNSLAGFEEKQAADKGQQNSGSVMNAYEQARADLIERGLKDHQVKILLKSKKPDQFTRILKIIEYFDFLKKSNSKNLSRNPIGFLYRAVENSDTFTIPEYFLNSGSDGQGNSEKKESRLQQGLFSEKNVTGNSKPAGRKESKTKLAKSDDLQAEYLIYRKQEIAKAKKSFDLNLLKSIRNDVLKAVEKLKGLLSEVRFNEVVEHGVDEKIAKLYLVKNFEDWSVEGRV